MLSFFLVFALFLVLFPTLSPSPFPLLFLFLSPFHPLSCQKYQLRCWIIFFCCLSLRRILIAYAQEKCTLGKKPNLINLKLELDLPREQQGSVILCPNILATALRKTLWMTEFLNSYPGLVVLCAHGRVCIIHWLWLSDSMHRASSVLAVHKRLSYMVFSPPARIVSAVHLNGVHAVWSV